MAATGEDVAQLMRAKDREKRERERPSAGELIGMMPDSCQRKEAGAGGEGRIAVAKVEHEHGAGTDCGDQAGGQKGNGETRLFQLRRLIGCRAGAALCRA